MKSKTKKAVILSVLKELEKGETPCSTDYGINPEEFIGIVLEMINNGLINDIGLCDGDNGDDPSLLSNAEVSLRGEEYLKTNSLMLKAYKEIKDWASIVIP